MLEKEKGEEEEEVSGFIHWDHRIHVLLEIPWSKLFLGLIKTPYSYVFTDRFYIEAFPNLA